MFDIFCHKITFVFQDTQIDVNDLIDLTSDIGAKPTKKQLISKLNALLNKRRAKHAKSLQTKTHDEEDTKLRKRDQDSEVSKDRPF